MSSFFQRLGLEDGSFMAREQFLFEVNRRKLDEGGIFKDVEMFECTIVFFFCARAPTLSLCGVARPDFHRVRGIPLLNRELSQMPALEFPALEDLMVMTNEFMKFVLRGMRGNWCVNFLVQV